MKQVTLILSLIFLTSLFMLGQNEEVKVYDPQADAATDVKNAIDKAAKENKNADYVKMNEDSLKEWGAK